MTTLTPSCDAAEVRRRLSEVMPHLKHAIESGQDWREAGLDSLDWVELLCAVESEFSVRLSELDLSGSGNLNELAQRIAARTQGAQS